MAQLEDKVDVGHFGSRSAGRLGGCGRPGESAWVRSIGSRSGNKVGGSEKEITPLPAVFEASVAAGLPASWDWQQPMILAVSGGADSMALLRAVASIAPSAARQRVIVAHVEYDLRDTAERDRRFVIAQAERLQLVCHWQHCPVIDSGEAVGVGLEAAARELRYSFFSRLAYAHGARHVATGHTLDDQAETILHRILRGTGIAGLAGMQRNRQLAEGVSLVRPMLGLRRRQVEEYLRVTGTSWVQDESNDDLRFARNILRHRLLAEAEQGPYPGATEAIVRLGEQAATLTADRAVTIEHLIERAVERQLDGSLLLHGRVTELAGGDRQLLADLFISLWKQEGWPRRDLSGRHLGQLTLMITGPEAVTGNAVTAASLPGGIRACRHPQGIQLWPPGASGS
ncbi:MAG: tRNA lysidine(34) synthetase TilS [Planctomycetia bacterium]|nr:tRNA lysidine(34) synthetase TilS [Planctomycetia bacterium]